ncbi:1-acyl-sn-glycerol-3-phosphate acyltransferase [Chitinophaga skermanii]|uniref:1-acyl-sn-glycerol-3-phosphate acyltransferase n=1 Tax=Chitinophaga skermanii TaxID=331697 RepID=A0A327Q7K5_9BACT|nr:lysophospholipid acyltransferase family protein [Chitinophaga skermanii]RAJ00370.1 1-acyl-sn-glycerol-3-phosphate acyltransferase [Chitinophaga skermanii]
MKWFRNILGRVYAVYGIIIFVVTMLIMIFPIWLISFLPDPKKTAVFLNLARFWMGFYLPMVFCPVKRKGLHHFKKGQNYVVVVNHNSLLDVPVTSPGVPGPNKTLAKKEFAKIPLFGILYKIGSVLVDRNDEKSRKDSLEHMKAVLDMGMHMLLFPEGTRNRTEYPLKSFYNGAFILAIETQKPIMVGIVFNTRKILTPGKFFYAIPHAIQFHFLPPIETTGLTLEDLPALKEKIFVMMWDYYDQHAAQLA